MLAEEKKPTVGEESLKRIMSGDKQEVGETSQAMNKTFEEELMECVQNYQKTRIENVKPFYVVILHKKERLMKNVIRRYFMGRETEPRPDYDQVVFKVEPKTQEVNFKWVIPDIETYTDMVFNGHLYPPDKQQLVGFCKAMHEDKLADYQRFQVIS